MMDWIIPGLYVLVYMDKRADGFDLINKIDLERPYVICPQLIGNDWSYVRKKIRSVNTLGMMQIVNHAIDCYVTSSEPLSTTISKPVNKKYSVYSPLVELMCAHSFLSEDSKETSDASSIAYKEMKRMGFDPENFYAEFIRVDFGTAGLHQYCLFGGLNRYVYNVLKRDKTRRKPLRDLISNMTDQWHEKIASYVGVILWSKVKVSPLLRGTLIDDSLVYQSTKRKREIEEAFQNLVMQAMLAYARNPL